MRRKSIKETNRLSVNEINELIAIYVMKVKESFLKNRGRLHKIPIPKYANNRNCAAAVIEEILFTGDDKLIKRFNAEIERVFGKEFSKMNTVQRLFYIAPVDICKAALRALRVI